MTLLIKGHLLLISFHKVWIWMDDPSYYGFPVYGDTAAVKAAEDVGGDPTSAATRNFETNTRSLDRLTKFLSDTIPGMVEGCSGSGSGGSSNRSSSSSSGSGAPRVKTCLYTLTRDRDFVLDTVPNHPGVQV